MTGRSLDQLADEVTAGASFYMNVARDAEHALAELVARAKAAEAQVCQFGCGPYPEGESPLPPGVGLVSACPVHGWVIPLLDASHDRAKQAEADRDRLLYICDDAARIIDGYSGVADSWVGIAVVWQIRERMEAA